MNTMNKSIDELKVRAKLALKSAKNGDQKIYQRIAKHNGKRAESEQTLKLKHCQNVVARESGFKSWQHAKKVLAAEITRQDNKEDFDLDMGALWHNNRCGGLTNLWFSRYQEAKAVFETKKNSYLIPYNRQFIVVEEDYIRALGISTGLESLWNKLSHDLVKSYPSELWDEMAYQVICNR